jgi:hypothetical protein
VLAAFEQAGGRTIRIELEDLKILSALRDLIAQNPPHLQAWLADRKPINYVKLFNEALHDAWDIPPHPSARPAQSQPRPTTPGPGR